MIFDASTSPERVPFPEVLSALADLAHRTGTDLLLVGATARDVALAAEGHDAARRATNDVDIAVAVGDQDGFDRLVAGLERAKGTSPHKFIVQGVEVDIVPFGGIEREDRSIEWRDGTQMNTLGLTEALRCALELRLPDTVVLKVASLPAQAALKVFAWSDRGHWTSRDAVDLATLLRTYSEGQRLDEIYAERNYALLELYEYDVPLVGAHLLGRDVRNDLGAIVAARCVEMVAEDQQGRQRLGTAMRGDIKDNLLLLDAFMSGAQPLEASLP